MAEHDQQVVVVRHGETAWSLSGQHTGLTDVPLTDNGRSMARRVGKVLQGLQASAVLVSPLQRARETCALAGFAAHAQVVPDLSEWHYGRYEGLTTAQICAQRPGWSLWTDGCPDGETAAQVGARVDVVLKRIHAIDGTIILFAHGHVLRVLAARWLSLDAQDGRLFALATGTYSTLAYERDQPVISTWNVPVAS